MLDCRYLQPSGHGLAVATLADTTLLPELADVEAASRGTLLRMGFPITGCGCSACPRHSAIWVSSSAALQLQAACQCLPHVPFREVAWAGIRWCTQCAAHAANLPTCQLAVPRRTWQVLHCICQLKHLGAYACRVVQESVKRFHFPEFVSSEVQRELDVFAEFEALQVRGVLCISMCCATTSWQA